MFSRLRTYRYSILTCVWVATFTAILPVDLGRVHAAEVTVTTDESKLRAAIVLGILRFSSWPNDVRMASAFNLCTLGEPASKQTLIKISGQRKYQQRPITTFVLNNKSPDVSKCNAIVIGPDLETKYLIELLNSKTAFGILTICDSCRPDNKNAMVYMIRKQNRVGFEVDLVQAKKNGMSFSSSLLELAIEVKQE